MKPTATSRRKPTQDRARHTVEAILDAVTRILKREGPAAVTTNRVAQVAGVSIGSLYQYFPDKNAIYAALHRRHVEQIDSAIHAVLVRHAASPIDLLVRALVDTMVDAHSTDPELYQTLMAQLPHRSGDAQDFSPRLHASFCLALAAQAGNLPPSFNIEAAAFVVTHMLDSLCHGAVLHRPPDLTLEDAKEEAARAILAYLRSPGRQPIPSEGAAAAGSEQAKTQSIT
jgi:AcrR family transcriptional regulator